MIGYSRRFELFESGKVVDEKCRDVFGSIVNEKESGRVGYYELPERSKKIVAEVKDRNEHSSIFRCDTVAVIGIGGSSLGAKAIDGMLRYKYPDAKKMIFLDNPDPMEIYRQFERIEKDRTIFVLISKSGSTIETITIFKTAILHFGLDIDGADRERIIVVTDEGSVLHDYAVQHSLRVYPVPENVGGRFSVLSAVGMVPLTLAGYETEKILDGARHFAESFFAGKEKHIVEKALFMAENRKRYPMNVLFAYGTILEDFTKWYVQLWGESLGKYNAAGERVGMTPLGQIGSVDQHSFLQLIVEGPLDKFVTFLKVNDFETSMKIPDISLGGIERSDFVNGHRFDELINRQCDATMESVVGHGVPADIITLDRISEGNIGELIYYYEILTSLTGVLLRIDTYSQPGVEMGKKLLREKFLENDS